jgi:hypothetical protein
MLLKRRIYELIKRSFQVGRQWLTHVILASWEAGVQRIESKASLGKSFKRPHLQNNQSKNGLEV